MARTPTRLSTQQQALLDAVATATTERDDAQEHYRTSILNAYDEGVPVAHIAHTIGVSHETIRTYIKRHTTNTP